jgi:hypothetical protein
VFVCVCYVVLCVSYMSVGRFRRQESDQHLIQYHANRPFMLPILAFYAWSKGAVSQQQRVGHGVVGSNFVRMVCRFLFL